MKNFQNFQNLQRTLKTGTENNWTGKYRLFGMWTLRPYLKSGTITVQDNRVLYQNIFFLPFTNDLA